MRKGFVDCWGHWGWCWDRLGDGWEGGRGEEEDEEVEKDWEGGGHFGGGCGVGCVGFVSRIG